MSYRGGATFACQCGATFAPTDDDLLRLDLRLCRLIGDTPEFLPGLIGLCLDIDAAIAHPSADRDTDPCPEDLGWVVNLPDRYTWRHVLAWQAWRAEIAAALDVFAPALSVA